MFVAATREAPMSGKKWATFPRVMAAKRRAMTARNSSKKVQCPCFTKSVPALNAAYQMRYWQNSENPNAAPVTTAFRRWVPRTEVSELLN